MCINTNIYHVCFHLCSSCNHEYLVLFYLCCYYFCFYIQQAGALLPLKRFLHFTPEISLRQQSLRRKGEGDLSPKTAKALYPLS